MGKKTTAETHVPHRACAAYYVNSDSGSQARLVLAIRSLIMNTDDDLDIVVLCDAHLSRVREAIADILGSRRYIEVYDMDETLASVGMLAKDWHRGTWPFGVVYRLGIPMHKAFAEYSRVLWLDLDVLVTSPRAKDLVSADLSGCEIRAATDVSWLQGRVPGLYNELGPDFAGRVMSVIGTDALVRRYVNAGVLLWNLEEIRKDLPWYKERLSMFWGMIKAGKFGYNDQDFVNSMMRVRADLASRFNSIYTTGQHECGALTHYVGGQYKEFIGAALEAGVIGHQARKEVCR